MSDVYNGQAMLTFVPFSASKTKQEKKRLQEEEMKHPGRRLIDCLRPRNSNERDEHQSQ